MTQLVKTQFGAHAQNYVTSIDHARGESLDRMLALTHPQPGWLILDIATGGGHTALAFAPRVSRVHATDLTGAMLQAARSFILGQGIGHMAFEEAEAGALPFAAEAFDLVTCRLAPHHFPDCGRFVREMARVLKPGGIAAVIDNVGPSDPVAARHVNAFEKLRDPSHGWMYSTPDWEAFYQAAGLTITALELFQKRMDFDRHCDRMAVPAPVRQQLRVLLKQAPAPALAVMAPEFGAEKTSFLLGEILIIGQRSPAA